MPSFLSSVPAQSAEERSLQRQTFVLAGFQSFVHRFERMLDGDWGVGENLFQDSFGAAD